MDKSINIVNQLITNACSFVLGEAIQFTRITTDIPDNVDRIYLINVLKTVSYAVDEKSKVNVSFNGPDFFKELAERIFMKQFQEKGLPLIKEHISGFVKIMTKI